MSTPDDTTHAGQLAVRVTELLGDLNLDERLELLGAMDRDDMHTSLAWIAAMYPQVFDFALVRDQAMTGRLETRLDEDQDDDGYEPYCRAVIPQAPGSPVPPVICNAAIGIFYGHGLGWWHYRGDGTPESPTELYDAGHAPVVAWRWQGEQAADAAEQEGQR